MVEPLLSGIVLGFIPVTLAGLFVAAYMQYRRGNQFDLPQRLEGAIVCAPFLGEFCPSLLRPAQG